MDATRLQKLAAIPRERRFSVFEGMPGDDHEVKMAQQHLAEIAQHAIELSKKIGTVEKNVPAWIQDHISHSYNYIKQANVGYHEI